MAGLLKPDRGRVRMFGRDVAALSYSELLALRRRMAMLFQNYALFDSLDVEGNVAFPIVEGARRTRCSRCSVSPIASTYCRASCRAE
jgi:phospholipid/cholesterol/gamma-HCH transport system ATP-binding protein